jgi:hypothetical protein
MLKLLFGLLVSVFIGVLYTFQTPIACAQTTNSCPAPNPGYTSAQQYLDEIYQKWQIRITNVGLTQAKAIHEIFHQIQGTRYLSLVKGAVITGSGGSVSVQVGCPGGGDTDVRLGVYDHAMTKVLILHELGHVIQYCQPDSVSRYSEINSAIASDGYISTYSRTNCFGGIQKSEDYAETLAFYLAPDANEHTCTGGRTLPNPYKSGRFQAHRALAAKVAGELTCGTAQTSPSPTLSPTAVPTYIPTSTATPPPTAQPTPTPTTRQTPPPTQQPPTAQQTPTPGFVCLGCTPTAVIDNQSGKNGQRAGTRERGNQTTPGQSRKKGSTTTSPEPSGKDREKRKHDGKDSESIIERILSWAQRIRENFFGQFGSR